MERIGISLFFEFLGDKLSIPFSIGLIILKNNNIFSVVNEETKKEVLVDKENGILGSKNFAIKIGK